MHKKDEGQAVLELAIVMPLLVLLFLGAIEFGRLCYVGIEVTNAAQAGASYGAQNHALASDVSGITAVAIGDGGNLGTLDSNWRPAGSAVAVQNLCGNVYSDPPSACTGAPQIEYVKVNTQVTVPSLFGVYGFSSSYTLHGQALARVQE